MFLFLALKETTFNHIGEISARKGCASFRIFSSHFTLSFLEHTKISAFLEKIPTLHCKLGNRGTIIFVELEDNAI